MKLILKFFSVALLPALAAVPAVAVEHVLDGEASCLALGGAWDAGTCRVHNYSIPFGTTLIVMPGITLVSESYFTVSGALVNHGTFIGYGIIPNYGPITNTGTFWNRAWLHPEGPIDNHGVFENEGLLDVCVGVVRNHAYFHNADTIENWGVIENDGLLVNDGYIHNPDLGFTGITNRGAVENNGMVDNEGILLCTCGAAWYGSGSVWGNPVEFAPCDAGPAIEGLTASVIELGPLGKACLSKTEVISLIQDLGRAGKRLAMGRPDLAVALLESFVGQVCRLVAGGKLPAYAGQELVARADRIIGILPAP